MKPIDRYKLSLHNIKNNRSRSILTTTIVFIISLLMIFILSIAISFSNNYNKIVTQYYQETDEEISICYFNYDQDNIYNFDYNNYQNVKQVINDNEEVIFNSLYTTNKYVSLNLQNHRFSNVYKYEIIEGRDTTYEDENTNKVLVSANFVQQYYEENKILLKPSSTFRYTFDEYISEDGYYKTYELIFEVVGIYKDNMVSNGYYDYAIYADIEYFLSKVEGSYIDSMVFYHQVTNTNFNKVEFRENLQNIVDGLNDFIPKRKGNDTVYCYVLNEIKLAELTSAIIIILAIFLCLVLILLSIGSLSNTIMISVDKNKRFIGLLKALGLNEKDLKSTIKMESITTIVMGVLLSFLALYLAKEQISGINTMIISTICSSYLTDIDYEIIYILPIYVPVIVLVFFIAFTLLFSRSSMSRIAKLDPIAVISEVS